MGRRQWLLACAALSAQSAKLKTWAWIVGLGGGVGSLAVVCLTGHQSGLNTARSLEACS
jgi:hypothetical protein